MLDFSAMLTSRRSHPNSVGSFADRVLTAWTTLVLSHSHINFKSRKRFVQIHNAAIIGKNSRSVILLTTDARSSFLEPATHSSLNTIPKPQFDASEVICKAEDAVKRAQEQFA